MSWGCSLYFNDVPYYKNKVLQGIMEGQFNFHGGYPKARNFVFTRNKNQIISFFVHENSVKKNSQILQKFLVENCKFNYIIYLFASFGSIHFFL